MKQAKTIGSDAVIISPENKITTVRVTERTKKLLESAAIRKETHEEIILRLIKLSQSMSESTGTEIMQKNNSTAIKYERQNKTIKIQTERQTYDIVCVFNDLNIYNLWRQNKRVAEKLFEKQEGEWELDLEIVNIRKDLGKWGFKIENKQEQLLLYLALVKHILEQIFDIKLYEIVTDKDYFNLDLWRAAYKRNNLSQESYYKDIEKKLD
jgi:hypothetical protein